MDSGWLRQEDVSPIAFGTPERPVRALDFESDAKRQRLPEHLRGHITPWAESIERGEASERFSADHVRRAQAILGLDQFPKSLEELRKAFRIKALACHPDKVPSNQREWATREMQQVNEAYVLLTARLVGTQTSGQSRGRLLALPC